MITANEAKQIVTEVRLKALTDIEKRIKEAAAKGNTCIWVPTLEDCVMKELEKAGYEVTYHSNYPDWSEYSISWEIERK